MNPITINRDFQFASSLVRSPISLFIKAAIVGVAIASVPANAATIVVDSNADDGSSCTLRDAVMSINDGIVLIDGCEDSSNNGLGVEDNILFDLESDQQSILLRNGEILVTKSTTISGANVNGVTVAASRSGSNASRVINVGPDIELKLDHINIRNGRALGINGGCINVSSGSSLEFLNGMINNCFSNNRGGGVSVTGGNLTLVNSLISQNDAFGGGGIYLGNESGLEMRNSTISGNDASEATIGGGLLVSGQSSATLRNVTVADNYAVIDGSIYSDDLGLGGGLGIYGTSTVTLINSIIADSREANDCSVSDSAQLIADASSIIESKTCNQSSNQARNIDPGLLSLRVLGGVIPVHGLTRSSRARNSGDNDTCETTDQNGAVRTLSSEDLCDVGAFESEFIAVDGDLFMIPLKNGKSAIFTL